MESKIDNPPNTTKKVLEYMALNERGVNCLRGIFSKFEGIIKINAELQRKESRKQIPKTILRWYQKNNRLFCRNNRLFLSAINKNNLKHIYVRLEKERITQTDLYWFTLTPRATSSPQKPLVIHYAIKTRLHTSHTKVSDIEPLKKHTTFGKPHQECWSWTPQEHTTLFGNTTTKIP